MAKKELDIERSDFKRCPFCGRLPSVWTSCFVSGVTCRCGIEMQRMTLRSLMNAWNRRSSKTTKRS